MPWKIIRQQPRHFQSQQRITTSHLWIKCRSRSTFISPPLSYQTPPPPTPPLLLHRLHYQPQLQQRRQQLQQRSSSLPPWRSEASKSLSKNTDKHQDVMSNFTGTDRESPSQIMLSVLSAHSSWYEVLHEIGSSCVSPVNAAPSSSLCLSSKNAQSPVLFTRSQWKRNKHLPVWLRWCLHHEYWGRYADLGML